MLPGLCFFKKMTNTFLLFHVIVEWYGKQEKRIKQTMKEGDFL